MMDHAGLVLWMRPANERRRYNVFLTHWSWKQATVSGTSFFTHILADTKKIATDEALIEWSIDQSINLLFST